MTNDTENAKQSSETAEHGQAATEQNQKKEPWWQMDPAGKESSFDHSNMNPDNIKSNDL
jgi:hypothetical protein